MGKDNNKNRYLSVAIPRTSRLLQRIEEVSRETNLPDSQILTYFAAEYVQLMDGLGKTLLQLASSGSHTTSGPMPSNTPILMGASTEGVNDEDLNAFGPPDE